MEESLLSQILEKEVALCALGLSSTNFPWFIEGRQEVNDSCFATVGTATHVDSTALSVIKGKRLEPSLKTWSLDAVDSEDFLVIFHHILRFDFFLVCEVGLPVLDSVNGGDVWDVASREFDLSCQGLTEVGGCPRGQGKVDFLSPRVEKASVGISLRGMYGEIFFFIYFILYQIVR